MMHRTMCEAAVLQNSHYSTALNDSSYTSLYVMGITLAFLSGSGGDTQIACTCMCDVLSCMYT